MFAGALLVSSRCSACRRASSPRRGRCPEGAEVFKKCRACHDVGATAKNKVGRLLNGMMGRQAGSIDGFNYLEANKAAGARPGVER
jgi:cytochrome c2